MQAQFLVSNYLTESLTSPYKVTWTHNNRIEFVTDKGTRYEAEVVRNGWFVFQVMGAGSRIRTNEGNSLRIGATIIRFLSDYLDRTKSGDEYRHVIVSGDDTKQDNLYEKLLKKFASKYKFKFFREPEDYTILVTKGDISYKRLKDLYIDYPDPDDEGPDYSLIARRYRTNRERYDSIRRGSKWVVVGVNFSSNVSGTSNSGLDITDSRTGQRINLSQGDEFQIVKIDDRPVAKVISGSYEGIKFKLPRYLSMNLISELR